MKKLLKVLTFCLVATGYAFTADAQKVEQAGLDFKGDIDIPIIPEFTVCDYFKNGDNGTTILEVTSWFENVILEHASDKVSLESIKLEKFKLIKYIWDRDILNELGNLEPYSIDEALAIIKHLTERQPKGEEGTLLLNSCANIFYVKAEDGRTVAIHMYWSSLRSAWGIYCYEFDEPDRWPWGRCVFSPAIAGS